MLAILITNDGTGSEKRGNYDVRVEVNGEVLARAHITGYDRAQGWYSLACIAVVAANGGTERFPHPQRRARVKRAKSTAHA